MLSLTPPEQGGFSYFGGQTVNAMERQQLRSSFHRALQSYDPTAEVACHAVGMDYVRRRVSSASGGYALDQYGHTVSDGKASAQADTHCRMASALPETWEKEITNALGRQVIENGRRIFDGQTRATGRPLAPLRG